MEKNNNEEKDKIKLFVFEFFSGIGGMNESMKRIKKLSLLKIIPYDININSNITYKFNYDIEPNSITIESLTLEKYEKIIEENLKQLNNNNIKLLWTMSPPCQPFTRQGNKLELEDNRSNAFKHLMNILNKTKYFPNYFFLENVKNFDNSKANEMIIDIFNNKKYDFLQFLLSPIQFNIPNSRLRYYFISREKKFDLFKNERKEIIKTVDLINKNYPNLCNIDIQTFLSYNKNEEKNKKEFYLGDKILNKESSKSMDLTLLESKSSNCFTKNYTRLIKGSGSILLLDKKIYYNNIDLKLLKGHIRFFTPKEILKFLSFNDNFEFPENLSVKSQYKLLGNSINVKVVSELMEILFNEN